MPGNDQLSTADREAESADDVDSRADRPGSTGEHVLQEQLGTVDRAEAFYDSAMQHELTERMAEFLSERWLGFLGGVDERPVTAPCVGDPGFVRIVDADEIAWPATAVVEAGRPLVASGEERFLSLVTVDWWDTTVGLHVNGVGTRRSTAPAGVDADPGTDWYVLDVEEAYIHCAKHLPELDAAEAGVVDDTAPRQDRYDDLTPTVERFIGSQVMAFLATADHDGETDISPRLGPAGFVQLLDEETLAWPEYRGNGVHASLGNIAETGVATLTFPDWWNTEAIVEVAGRATLHDEVAGATDLTDVDRTKQWVRMDVERVTVTREPPLPALSVAAFDPPWGTDDDDAKKSGFFVD